MSYKMTGKQKVIFFYVMQKTFIYRTIPLCWKYLHSIVVFTSKNDDDIIASRGMERDDEDMLAHEIELVKRVQAGDERAFDELYRAYYGRAISLAYRLTKDRSDAQDVVQDSFIQVHKSIQSLKDPQYFYSWLNRIIHSKCVNLFYRNRNENAIDPSKMESVREYEEKRRYMLPQAENDFISEQEVLKQILSQMDDKYREVLELAYFKQLKLNEIAAYLNLPLGTVKTRCRRAKEDLKGRIELFEQAEQRRISFRVDALFPTLTAVSLANFSVALKQKVSDFFMGQAVNVACVTSLTVLAISGGAMAISDYQEAQEQAAQYQELATKPMENEEIPHPQAEGLRKSFGSYTYEDIQCISHFP